MIMMAPASKRTQLSITNRPQSPLLLRSSSSAFLWSPAAATREMQQLQPAFAVPSADRRLRQLCEHVGHDVGGQRSVGDPACLLRSAPAAGIGGFVAGALVGAAGAAVAARLTRGGGGGGGGGNAAVASVASTAEPVASEPGAPDWDEVLRDIPRPAAETFDVPVGPDQQMFATPVSIPRVGQSEGAFRYTREILEDGAAAAAAAGR